MTHGTPPSWWGDLIDGFRETWRARNLVYQLAVRDIRIRYKEAALGLVWAVVMPCLVVVSGLVIRIAMAGGVVGDGLRVLILALATKGLAWSFFSGAVGAGTSSLTGSAHLVSKIYFPRAVLPIAAVVTQAFDTAIAMTVMAILLPWLGAQWSAALLWVPLLLLLLLALTSAVAVLLSCANVFFRDVRYLVQVMLTFGIFFTPVFFDASMFGERGIQLLMLNPLAPLLEGLYLAICTGHDLLTPLVIERNQEVLHVWLPQYLAYSAAWAIGGLFLASLFFRRAESLFAEFV